jgi:monofunctional biosynthetic peptidoglycan transglycosylase
VLRDAFRWTLRLAAAFVALSLAGIAVYRLVDPPFTPLMGIRWLEGVRAAPPLAIRREWVHLDRMSPALRRAVIASEDARFLEHHGVDWTALRAALRWNAAHPHRRGRGASTITMQCARNLFLWPGRSYVRKALEVWLAALLDLCWSKARILEVYLNVIEWGPGVYGAEAAARSAFDTTAARLDARQAALLAAVLPNPLHWSAATPNVTVLRRATLIARRVQRTASRITLDVAPRPRENAADSQHTGGLAHGSQGVRRRRRNDQVREARLQGLGLSRHGQGGW